MIFGWNPWDLNLETPAQEARDEIKKEKKEKNKEKTKTDKAKKVDNLTKQYEKDQKEEIKQGKKDVTCSHATSSGKRCKRKPVKNGKCTIHEEVEMLDDKFKDRQCRKRKSDGSRCKLMTRSKSQLCFYHD